MDVHRLRILRAVVADGSVNGAATALGYTPSAVSQQLSTLQRESGLQLIRRVGRGITVTDAGRSLADRAGHVLQALAEVESLAADLRAGRSGSLSVSYFASAGTAWIPQVVAALSHEFPDLRLDLRLVELEHGRSDAPDVQVFVMSGDTTPDGFTDRELVVEPYFAVVPAGSPLADRGEVPLTELRSQLWVDNDVARGPCRAALLDACATVGFMPAFHIEAQDYPTAISFVAAGVGVTVIPRLGLHGLPDGVRAVPIVDPTPRRRIGLRIRDAAAGAPPVRRVVELLERACAPSPENADGPPPHR